MPEYYIYLCIRYFDKNLPEDNVPFADFDASEDALNPKDSSATAIVASALFEIFELTGKMRRTRHTCPTDTTPNIGTRVSHRNRWFGH